MVGWCKTIQNHPEYELAQNTIARGFLQKPNKSIGPNRNVTLLHGVGSINAETDVLGTG